MLGKHFVGLAAVAVMAIGCSLASKEETADRSSSSDEKQGLTIVSADPVHGLVGLYREGKHVVRFEAIRTIVTHDDWKLYDSSGVPVSISSRFTAPDGSALYTSLGDWAPESWGGETQPEMHFTKPPT
jgi:hypothetical protein